MNAVWGLVLLAAFAVWMSLSPILLINELFVAQRLKTSWEDFCMSVCYYLGTGPEFSLQKCAAVYLEAFAGLCFVVVFWGGLFVFCLSFGIKMVYSYITGTGLKARPVRPTFTT